LFFPELKGKTVGVLGHGHVRGHRTVRLSAAFGANVLAAMSSGQQKPQSFAGGGIGDSDGSIQDAWFSKGVGLRSV